jgi:hypothetical protein
MRQLVLLIVLSLLCTAAVQAVTVDYSIEATVMSMDNETTTAASDLTTECEDECIFPIDVNSPPELVVQSYRLIFDSDKYDMYFNSTNDVTTSDLQDMIVLKIKEQAPPEPEPEPVITCNENACEKGCVKCADAKCHDPGFVCTVDFSIEKITPTSTKLGIAQLNILIKNTGNVDLDIVSAEVSGDGIETIESTPIATLAAGDKDYVFVQINASKPGNIDLVIKLYIENMLNRKSVGQLTVIKPKVDEPVQVNKTPEFDPTVLSDQLDQLREKYKTLDADYNGKKSKNYNLDTITDDLKELHTQILSAQSYLYDGDYKKTQTYLALAKETMGTVEQELNDAKPTVVKFSDKLKSNLIYIGSIAAAIVSTITAITLTRQHVVNKERLSKIAGKMKRTKQEEVKAEEKPSKKPRKPRKKKESGEAQTSDSKPEQK